MINKKYVILLVLLISFLAIQGCNSITPKDTAEPEIKNTTENITQSDTVAENNPEGEDDEMFQEGENINFTGPLTDNYLDRVNVYAICTAGFQSLFDKMVSRWMKWSDFSDLLQDIMDAVDVDTEELIDKENVFVNEVLLRNTDNLPKEKLEELDQIRLKYKFLEIEYKDIVKVPIKDKTISTNNIVIFHLQDKNILEVYFNSSDSYIKYEVEGFVEEFIKWYDDFRKRRIEWAAEGL